MRRGLSETENGKIKPVLRKPGVKRGREGLWWGRLKIKQEMSKEFGSEEVNTDTEGKVQKVQWSIWNNGL